MKKFYNNADLIFYTSIILLSITIFIPNIFWIIPGSHFYLSIYDSNNKIFIFTTIFFILSLMFIFSFNSLIKRNDEENKILKSYKFIIFLKNHFNYLRTSVFIFIILCILYLISGVKLYYGNPGYFVNIYLLPVLILIDYSLLIERYCNYLSKPRLFRLLYNLPILWIIFLLLKVIMEINIHYWSFWQSELWCDLNFIIRFIIPILYIVIIFFIPKFVDKKLIDANYPDRLLNIGEIVFFWLILIGLTFLGAWGLS